MMWVQLCLMVCLGHMVSGQVPNLVPCEEQPPDNDGPPLPTLPNQFQTHIEANFVQKNMTRSYTEYYDYPGNRLAFVSYNRTNRAMIKTLVKFNEKEARFINADKTCRFMRTNGTNTTSSHFIATKDGSHLISVKDMLYFGDDMREEFIDGDKKVRGIEVNHWRTCVKMPQTNGTFTLDYYFSKGSGYFIDGDEVQLPIRAVINGTGKSRHFNGSISESYHSFYHIYEFFDFKPGVFHDPTVFEVPVGVICNKGDIPENESVPELSQQFSVGIEKVALQQGREIERLAVQLHYDNSANVYRMDRDIPIGVDLRLYGPKPLTYIHDDKLDLLYVIDKLERNCTVSRFQRHPRFPPPTILQDFFRDLSSFIYQGQKSWRGLPVYSWGFYNSSSHEVTEIFYHSPEPGQLGRLDPHTHDNMVPVGLYKNVIPSHMQQEMTTYEHLYGFNNGHPDPDLFDVSICYALDKHSKHLVFDVTGPVREAGEVVRFHQREFVSGLRQAIATAGKVSLTRVASLKWGVARSDKTSITLLVTFELLDNKLYGLDDTVYTGPSLSDAITNLQKSINSGTSQTFDVKLGTSHSVKLSILAGSLWEKYYDTSDYQPETSSVKRYGSGSMAGLGIGMLIIGALLGLLAAYVIYRRIDTSVPYQVTK